MSLFTKVIISIFRFPWSSFFPAVLGFKFFKIVTFLRYIGHRMGISFLTSMSPLLLLYWAKKLYNIKLCTKSLNYYNFFVNCVNSYNKKLNKLSKVNMYILLHWVKMLYLLFNVKYFILSLRGPKSQTILLKFSKIFVLFMSTYFIN